MALPSEFAFDTETDSFDGDIRTCMIQICPVGASSLDDVKVFLGRDCYDQFFDRFEETLYNMDCRTFNLDYEFEWLFHAMKDRYTWTESRQVKKGEWNCSMDESRAYIVRIRNHHGKVLRFTDDAKRAGNYVSLRSVGEAVKRSYPEWFEGMEKVKEDVDYNNGWSAEGHPDHEKFIHYGKLDAYTQAMVARWMDLNGLNKANTSAGNGLNTALCGRFKGKEMRNCDGAEIKYAKVNFKRYYPPLNREMQDILEESLLGGFVWGVSGVHKGTFVHLDYSSSYPYEYAYGNLGRGQVVNLKKKMWQNFMEKDGYIRWYVVSFDFTYKNGPGMPCLNGSEGGAPASMGNKKMREGRVEHRLYTESYLHEI